MKKRGFQVFLVTVAVLFVASAALAQTADEWYEKGFNYKIEGNIEKSLECFTKAIEIDPTFVEAYSERGWIYRVNLKEYKKALEDYKMCVKLDPDNSSWYLFRGNTYYGLGELRKAIKDYTKGIEIYPDHQWLYDNRASAYNDLGEYKKALKDANKAVEQSPNFYLGYLVRGKAYEGLGRAREARKDFEKACELGNMEACRKFGGESAEAWFRVGEQYRVNKDYKNALDCFTRAIELDPKHKHAYNRRAQIYVIMGKYNEAFDEYSKHLSVDPNCYYSLYSRGEILLKLGRKKEALKDFKRACDLDYDKACEKYEELK